MTTLNTTSETKHDINELYERVQKQNVEFYRNKVIDFIKRNKDLIRHKLTGLANKNHTFCPKFHTIIVFPGYLHIKIKEEHWYTSNTLNDTKFTYSEKCNILNDCQDEIREILDCIVYVKPGGLHSIKMAFNKYNI